MSLRSLDVPGHMGFFACHPEWQRQLLGEMLAQMASTRLLLRVPLARRVGRSTTARGWLGALMSFTLSLDELIEKVIEFRRRVAREFPQGRADYEK